MTDDKWIPPNGPNMKGDFDKSHNPPPKDDDHKPKLSPVQQEYRKYLDHRSPMSAAELRKELELKKDKPIARKSTLEELLAERGEPKRILDLTPGGMGEKYIHQKLSREKEQKIGQLTEQLAPRWNQAKDDFNRER